jgi:hypothetical protein
MSRNAVPSGIIPINRHIANRTDLLLNNLIFCHLFGQSAQDRKHLFAQLIVHPVFELQALEIHTMSGPFHFSAAA